MNTYHHLIENIPIIQRRLRYVFKNLDFLQLAFVHRSFVNENKELVKEHNERLEFLGDSVLGMVVAEYLYTEYPEKPEGELSYLRSRIVEASSCMEYLLQLELGEFVLLGRGEKLSPGKGRDSIFADLFEALIGAVYLDGGYEAAKHFFLSHFEKSMKEIIANPENNWKALLQDYTQKLLQSKPEYELVQESGPDHQKTFHITVTVGGKVLGEGKGLSKKEAQQEAAKKALKALEES